jgi:hypothetical protein
MWPPEGSVSPEAVALYAQAGIGWLATDEGNLWRSLDGSGGVTRGDLYRPWRHHGVDMLFRDREISDKIGFAYAHGSADSGVQDLLARARAAAAQSTAPAPEPALVPIFLDGENPWESYPDDGQPFLRALFTALSHDAQLKTASIKQHLEQAPSRRELPSLHSGSWIDSDFHIWIADPVKNRAWELLGQARAAFAQTHFSDENARAAAHERLLAAEGSDWFWWFGEPFHSMEDALFDALFRAHLHGAYQAMGLPPPPALDEPVAHARPLAAEAVSAPYAFITPRIGGDGFYDWQGAGRYAVPRGAAMADNPLVAAIRFGFDRTTLYLRLEPSEARASELAAVRLDLELAVGETRTVVHARGDELVVEGVESRRGGHVVQRRTLELAAPLTLIGARAGDRLSLVLRLLDDVGAPLGRYPADGAIRVIVPGDEFEAENWSA